MKIICTQCGTKGRPKTETSGSFIIEVLLWCFMILPGIIYSLWRMTTKQKVCKRCRSTRIVPLDTPMGERLNENNN